MPLFKRKQAVEESSAKTAFAESTSENATAQQAQRTESRTQDRDSVADLFVQLQVSEPLAGPSRVAGRLVALSRRELTGQDVARIAGSDSALAAEILKLANSALLKRGQQAASLADVVAAMGPRRTQLLAVSFALLSPEARSPAADGFDEDRFHSESLAFAVAACVIAQRTNSYRPEDAFAAGLVSNIGRLALAVGLPAQYAPVLRRASELGDLPTAERELLDFSQTQLGARLLQHWGLPPEVCEAVAEFSQVTPASHVTSTSPLTTILHVADLVIQAVFSTASAKQSHERVLGAAEFFLRVDDQTWAQIFQEISRHWRDFGVMSAGAPAQTGSPEGTTPARPQRPAPTLNRPKAASATPRAVKSLGGLRPQSATAPAPAPEPTSPEPDATSQFVPHAPQTLQDAGLTPDDVELLICKFLLARGSHAGRAIATHLGLPFVVVEPLLVTLKNDLILSYKNSAPFNDYEYELTDTGRERARRYLEECTYFGTAPVPLRDYIAAVEAQSLTAYRVGEEEVREAFQDLCICDNTLRRIGRAVNSGRGMFLYGSPGNGKTSIAERITNCFGTEIWIPRTLTVDGEVLRLFDPAKHDEVDQGDEAPLQEQRIDRRWVKVQRPTIVSGGELTMAELEVQHNPVTKVSEAPLQLKSNCGALVIDDFGRQRISTDQLLNRWIVPLEKRHDFLNLANGKKVQVPFDQLIIFSTNLEPRDLVDEAFLRRIPYKIQVDDPTPEEFAAIFDVTRRKLGFPENRDAFDYLTDRHYKQAGRPLRCCHPRDLLLQVRNDCAFRDAPLELTRDALDAAIEDYFAIM